MASILGRALVAVIAGSLALAACGASPAAPTGVEPAVCAAGQIDGDLRVHLPGDVLPPDVTPAFASRFGVEVEVSQFASVDELIAQVEARVSDFDLIIADQDTIRIMVEGELLVPLSPEALPGRSNLMTMFTDPPYDPGSAHTTPYIWGTVGLGVNTNVVGRDVPATWGLVFDPELADRFAGRISVLDDSRYALGAALRYLGYSMNSENADQISEASELLASARMRISEFTSAEDSVDLVNGATDVAQGPSDRMFDAFEEAEAWDDYQYVIPVEGAAITVDALAVPVTAQAPCTAHAFMDFLLDPMRGVQVAVWNRSASPNAGANELIPTQLASDPGLYPPPETMANLEFIRPVADEVAYVDAFEQAKR